MSRDVAIHHCGECPAHRPWSGQIGGEPESCRIEKRSIEMDDPERPEWCPLEAGPVVLRLRREEE
jgi:hypothetical protein